MSELTCSRKVIIQYVLLFPRLWSRCRSLCSSRWSRRVPCWTNTRPLSSTRPRICRYGSKYMWDRYCCGHLQRLGNKSTIDNSKQVINLEVVCLLDAQGELDRALGGIRSHTGQMKGSVELQRQYEQLVRSLEELLALRSERLALQPGAELHNRAQLQQQHRSHTVSL